MPAEAARLRRAVGGRDRRFLAALALLGATGAAAGVLLHDHGGGNAERAGPCLSLAQAGVMGGGAWHACGEAAVALCRAHAGSGDELARRCGALLTRRR